MTDQQDVDDIESTAIDTAATAIVADANETEAVPLAWSDGDDPPEVSEYRPPSRLTSRLLWVAMVAVVIGGGSAIYYTIHRDSQRTQEGIRQPQAAPPPPAKPLLNGTYRIDYDWERTTARNNKRQGGGVVHWDHTGMPASTWLAFRSACTEMDCIATGIRLDNQNHEKAATPEVRGVLRLVNGVWQDMTPTQVQAQATYTDDGSAACTAWQSVRFNLEPRPDGTFRGDRIQSTDTNECGNQGDTIVTPITATRVGGVPPGVLDNAEQSSAPASSSPAPSSIVTVTATPQPAPQAAPAPWQAAPDPDLLFLNLVSQIPVTITDSAVLTASGRSICGDLQHGMTPAQVAAANVGNNGMTFAQTSAIVNAAITAFCPQYAG